MIIQRFIVVSLFLVVSSPAFCIEENKWALDINLASIHQKDTYGDGKKYNEDNFGLGVSYGYSDSIDLKIGFYDNSFNRTTEYIAALWQKDFHYKALRISPGIGAFLVTGYDGSPEFAKKIQLGVMPALSFAYKNLALHIGLYPSVKSNNVVTFQFQFGF